MNIFMWILSSLGSTILGYVFARVPAVQHVENKVMEWLHLKKSS